MIKNQWYVVLESKEVKKGKITGVLRLGEKLIFWRDNKGIVQCIYDRCCHRGVSLTIGKVCDNGESVQCPFHGFRFNGNGECILIPANGTSGVIPKIFKQKSYHVREFDNFIYIWFGEDLESYPDIPRFIDIDINKFSYATYKSSWNVHYSRAIENQLDVVHIPFVHAKTIGRGYRTLVNGPVERASDKQIEFWVYNDKDEGQKLKELSELPEPDSTKQHLHFIFPNLWQNFIIDKLRVFVAFVPVDEENTLIYMRTYQSFVMIPVIRNLMDHIMKVYSKKILMEDKEVVSTQLPKKTWFKMDEKLIKGDRPISTYRRIRDKLQG